MRPDVLMCMQLSDVKSTVTKIVKIIENQSLLRVKKKAFLPIAKIQSAAACRIKAKNLNVTESWAVYARFGVRFPLMAIRRSRI